MGIKVEHVTERMMSLMSPEQREAVTNAASEAFALNEYKAKEHLVFLSERDMHDEFEKWLKKRGFLFIHSRMDQPTTVKDGAFDFAVLGHCRGVMVEFKWGKNKPSKAQLAFQKLCRSANVPAEVFWSVYEAQSWVLEQFGLSD
jgi:hypothetical protein